VETTRHDDAPVAAGAPHHITRPGEGSAPAPLGNVSGNRTDERPASCTHPVLWPLCGCAAVIAARRQRRQLAREHGARLVAEDVRAVLAAAPDRDERREVLRDLRLQAYATLNTMAELSPPIDELARVLGEPPPPTRPGRPHVYRITVVDAYGDQGTIVTVGPGGPREITRWVTERISGIPDWTLTDIRPVTDDDPLPEEPRQWLISPIRGAV